MDVVGYRGLYEVSNQGRIRSVRRKGSVGRILKPVKRRDGRLRVSLSSQGVVKDFLLHRVVLMTFVGPCPEGFEACHWDDNPENNALENLRWASHEDNIEDKRRNGRLRGQPKNSGFCRRGRHTWSEENIYRDPQGFDRCRGCSKEAMTRYRTQGLPDGDKRHGTRIGGRRGCKCGPCVSALRDYQRVTERNRERRQNG